MRKVSSGLLDASPLRCQTTGVQNRRPRTVGFWGKRIAAALFACSAPACGLDIALAPTVTEAVDASVPAVTEDSGRATDANVGASKDAMPAPVDAEPCVPGPAASTDAAPKTTSFSIVVSGQTAWVHDDQKSAGYFHTYDALVPKSGTEAHKVHVFLPRGYSGGGCKRYPVIYMNDGNTSFWPGGSANKTWGVAEVLADAYAKRTVREVIVVAIEPVERNREYTHTPWLLGEACCGASVYAAFLADAVVPFVDAAYRTKKGRADTFVLGSSHGGLSAFYVSTRRPEVFGGAIAMSSSFWVGQDDRVTGSIGGPLSGSALIAQVGPNLTASNKPRLYLDWGLVRDGGFHNAIIEERATVRGREMATLLEGAPYGYVRDRDLFTVEDPKGEHEEISWGRRLGRALATIVGP